MSIEISEQLNLSKPALLYPQYKLRKATIVEGSGSTVVGTAGGQSNTFEIVNGVFNFSKSILQYTVTPAADGAKVNVVPVDLACHIASIEIMDRKGTIINRTLDLGVLSKVCWKPETKVEDLLSFNTYTPGAGFGKYLRCSNAIKTVTTAALMATRYGGPGVVADRDYIEPQYTMVGAATTPTPVINFSIDLKMMYNTIMSVDKDLYFNDTILMKITWQQSIRAQWLCTANTDVGTGAAITAGGYTISNLNLYVAYEKNQDIINSIIGKFKSGGIELIYDHVSTFKRNLSGTTQSQSIKLNKSHGISLKRVYYSMFHNTESSLTMYDNSNVAAAKVTNFNTSLDNQKLQEFTITAGSLDYMLLQDQLKGSAIMSQDVYNYNWFWCDRFDDSEGPLCFQNESDSQGLDLSIERDYMFESVTPSANINHYTFAICQKLLKVTPEGIMVI